MIFYVYILICTSKKGKISHYTGHTNNMRRRYEEHKKGKGNGARYTKGKRLLLGHYEELLTRKDAIKREHEIKKYSIKQKRALILKHE